MSTLQALIMAILQGVTELFPVSSLGHAVVLPKLLGWNIDQHSRSFLPFLVVLHLGTAIALLAYFWRDWLGLLLAFFGVGSVVERKAQWRLDFVAAENSMGFHAPAESARILGEAIDYARQAQLGAR